MSEWQPIESAPKDGSLLDLFVPGYGRIINEWWDIGHGCWSCEDIGDPSHWMKSPGEPK